jgi:Fe-S cluster assembly ATPase SufC
MSDQIEELIREIAAKHGIAVARDDPILVLQTINNRLLQDSAKAQQAQLDQFKEEMESVSLRWKTDAREKAERIVNASLSASKDAMDQMLKMAAQEAAAAVRNEMEVALERLGVLSDRNWRYAAICVTGASITLLASIIFFYFR